MKPKIDKVIIKCIPIVSITKREALIAGNILVTSLKNDTLSPDDKLYTIKKDCSYNSILVSEPTFRFESRTRIVDNKDKEFTYLELYSRSSNTRNLSCSSCNQLRQRFYNVVKILRTEYGIIIKTNTATLHSIEINKDVILNYPFKDYERAILMLTYNWSKGYRRSGLNVIYDYESQNINEPHPHTEWTSHINTYYLDNGVNNKKTEAVKIYNKTQALAEKGVEEEFLPKSDILRFEITLKTSEFICKKLGTSNIHELSDENINEYFDHFILKRLIKISLVNYNSSLYNSVFSIIPSKKELHCTNWIGHFLTTLVSYEINEHKIYLLDIDDIKEFIIPCYSNKSGGYKALRSIKKYCKEDAPQFLNNNGKVFEILSGLYSLPLDTINIALFSFNTSNNIVSHHRKTPLLKGGR